MLNLKHARLTTALTLTLFSYAGASSIDLGGDGQQPGCSRTPEMPTQAPPPKQHPSETLLPHQDPKGKAPINEEASVAAASTAQEIVASLLLVDKLDTDGLLNEMANNNHYAAYTLGMRYARGQLDGAEQAYTKYADYIIRAADENNLLAMAHTISLPPRERLKDKCQQYKDNLLEPEANKELFQALNLLREKHNNTDATFLLGKLLCDGALAPPDRRAGMTLLRESAEQGNVFAQCALGLLPSRYRVSASEKMKWVTEAAKNGFAAAQTELGRCHDIHSDYAEAAKWYRLAAAQGYTRAQCMLGDMYLHGHVGVENCAEGVEWYRIAATQGDASAQVELGDMYLRGRRIERDHAEAAKWYRLAATQGYASAQYKLGDMYFHGRGVERDYAEAAKWFQCAATQRNMVAQKRLGDMYEHGRGIAQNYRDATKWYIRRMHDTIIVSADFEKRGQLEKDFAVALPEGGLCDTRLRTGEPLFAQVQKQCAYLQILRLIDPQGEQFHAPWYSITPNTVHQALLSYAPDASDEDIEEIKQIYLGIGDANDTMIQEFLYAVTLRDRAHTPGSFYYNHAKMMEVRAQPAAHNPREMDNNITLNLDENTKPRMHQNVPIMPKSVWSRLFEGLRAHPEIVAATGSDPDTLLALQGNAFFGHFLDADNAQQAPQNMSTTNYQFRCILDRINRMHQSGDPQGALGCFAQLLANVQTCASGKNVGIAHTYNLLNDDVAMDEQAIDTERFKQEIKTYFAEELRRLRQTALTNMMTQGHGVSGDITHSRDYLMGAIGEDIGLTFAGEKPAIDINGHLTAKELVSQTKQELLDKFYEYYTPEGLIDRIHENINNGAISIPGKKGQALAAEILSSYFSVEEKFDPQYTVFGGAFGDIPEGLTPKAAEALLIKLGFLTHSANQTTPHSSGASSSGS